jgi:hypothetical protein
MPVYNIHSVLFCEIAMNKQNEIQRVSVEANLFFDIFHKKLSSRELDILLIKQGLKSQREIKTDETKFFGRIRRYFFLYRCLPFVRMVALCNAVAMGTADENSDIDLFFIVKKGRIFLARTIATLFFHMLGIRRHDNKVKGRFCLTFFVTEDNLNLDKIKIRDGDDIYLKYWILTLQPLSGGDVYIKFMQANDFVGAGYCLDDKKGRIKAALEWLIDLFGGDFLEKKLRQIHLKRLKRRTFGNQANIVVSDEMLKFHNIDMREHFANEYEKRIRNSFPDEASSRK